MYEEYCEFFTIQNVPIKFMLLHIFNHCLRTLQYKMFLLNIDAKPKMMLVIDTLQYKMFLLNVYWKLKKCLMIGLYNTKCSY